MEKNHPVSELMAETIEKIKEAVDANTVVGEPIVAGEITLIPVSKISLGFGTGGSEMGGENPEGHGGESLWRRRRRWIEGHTGVFPGDQRRYGESSAGGHQP